MKPLVLVRKFRSPWPVENLPSFVLQQDNWNDYGYKTLYQLYYVSVDKKGKVVSDLIGPVKILRLGQSDSDPLQVREDFTKLGDDFCSVGSSLDYYERLRHVYSGEYKSLLVGLRDIVRSPSVAKAFRSEAGWSVSLFRDGKSEDYLKLARGILVGDFTKLPSDELEFSLSFSNWLSKLSFSFTQKEGGRKSRLPGRISVLIGDNGAGKSTVLARLARLAFATIDEREETTISSLGSITPRGIGFPRVITISFSPFDSFKLPGVDTRNRKKIIDEMEHGVGRYAFIGLRDVRGEARYSAKGEEMVLDLFKDPDRHGQTKLKTVEKLTDEFMGYLRSIKEPAKVSQLNSIFSSLLADSAFGPLLNKSLIECEDFDIKPAFLLCSTGHKIAALVVAGLIAKLVPSSLVLFDEPETHLHPPLLAALMNAIRAILHNDESFCVIATHSPVVVQESMAEDVKVIKREGSITSVSGLTSETFGESIGLITAEVFGLNAETTDYHRVLDNLVSKYSKQEELEALFLNGQMSHQARGYTMSRRLLLKKGK